MLTRPRQKKTDTRKEWFKYQLRLRRSSFSAIAKALRISRPAVSRGILNPSSRLADAVSEALGKSKSELWPDRYSEHN